MELKLNSLGKVKIIEIHGKFDIESTEEFEALFQKQMEENPSILVIDMNKLEYIDSSGIGSLIKSLNTIKNKKGNLILVGLNNMILNVFKLAKLDMFFQIMTNDEFKSKFSKNDDSDIDELLKGR
ncbi:MAG: STAS domain-containing protein [Leptospiraceae bacterium]|nr:STAS domain-containing protein [Leptospiraceae bacterium]